MSNDTIKILEGLKEFVRDTLFKVSEENEMDDLIQDELDRLIAIEKSKEESK